MLLYESSNLSLSIFFLSYILGSYKKIFIDFLNKRNYPLIKIYSFYKKDIWGFLKMRRLYKYKRAIYNMLRKRRKFYYRILNQVYKGIFFSVKRYNYKANLFFIKKRVKLFYGSLKLSYIGKLGVFLKGKKGAFLNNFFSFLERRIDVVLYRSFYTITVRMGRRLVCLKYVIRNNFLLRNPNLILFVGDIIHVNHFPFGSLYLYLIKGKIVNNYYKRIFYLIFFKKFLEKTLYFKNKNFTKFFFVKSFKKFLYRSRLFKKKVRRKHKIKRLYQRFIDFFFFLRSLFYRVFKRFAVKFKKRLTLVKLNPIYKLKFKFLKKRKKKLLYLLYKNLEITNMKKLLLIDNLYKIKKNFDTMKKFNLKKKKIRYIFIFVFKFVLLNLYRFFKYLRYIKYQYFFIRQRKKYVRYLLYFNNLNIYRLRFRRFLYLLYPKKRKFLKNYPLIKRAKYLNLKKVKFRKWKFSFFVFKYLARFSDFEYFFFGFPSYLVVDYLTHTICITSNPSRYGLKYPFGNRVGFFFNYFKNKAYF